MGFRFQRRLNLTRGMGLNISKSGVSASFRTPFGTVGFQGFSVRTGIPWLSYRHRYGSGACAALILLVVVIALLPLLIQLVTVTAQLLWLATIWCVRVLVIAPCNLIVWAVMT